MLVPKKRTNVTLEQLVPAFAKAFAARFGEMPEAIDCAAIFGKMTIECGHPPEMSLWCNNVGNVRGRSPRGNYCLLAGAHEYVDANKVPKGWHVIPNPAGHVCPPGKVAVLPDDISSQEFRAYDTLEEACEDYVAVLDKSFKRAMRELTEDGTDPGEFVDALKADRYFTGDVTVYRNSVISIAKGVLPKVEALLVAKPVLEPVPTRPETPSSKRVELLSDLSLTSPATLLRAGEGEHTPREPDT